MVATARAIEHDPTPIGRRARRAVLAVLILLAALVVAPGPAAAESDASTPALTEVDVPVRSAWSATGSAVPRPAVPGADTAAVDAVTRLYLAVFGRLPDETGHRYWVSARVRGVPAEDVAAAFVNSIEWHNRYGAVDDATYVERLYANVLGRAAEPEGAAYWRSVLADDVSRAEVVIQFADSTEFVRRTGTEPPPPPFPPVPAGSGSGRRIVYHNSAQRVWLIEADGSVHDSYLVSGRRETPGPGVYSVYSKSPKAWAGHDGITMDHMVRFARGRSLAIGFHSIPVRPGGIPLQSLDELGTWRSAGCVRQDPVKAAMLYDWAGIGTTVVVLP